MNLLNNSNIKKIKIAPNYAVTSCGKVLSLTQIKTILHPKTKQPMTAVYNRVVKELKQSKGTYWQLKVYLIVDGKTKTCYVKNLVAEAFKPKPKGKKNLIVWHIDENKENNAAENLEYIPFKQLCLTTNSHNYRLNLKK